MLTFRDVINNTSEYEQLKKQNRDEITLYYSDFFDADVLEAALDKVAAEVKTKKIIIINGINAYNKILLYLSTGRFTNSKIYMIAYASSVQELERLIELSSHQLPIEVHGVNKKDITRISKKSRSKIGKSILLPLAFNHDIMPCEQFLEYIDKIVWFINQNSQNDYQKVLLLGKIISKNFKYDKRFIFFPLDYANKIAISAHDPESLLATGKGVCNAISGFVSIVLNHPDINIETDEVGANFIKKKNEGHAWNEVKIDGKWYSCDFTGDMPAFTFGILKLYCKLERIKKYFVEKIESRTNKRMFDLKTSQLDLAGFPLKEWILLVKG